MKTCIQFILSLLFMATSYLHTQNISAGINDAGSSIPISSTDPNWRIIAGPAGAMLALSATSVVSLNEEYFVL